MLAPISKTFGRDKMTSVEPILDSLYTLLLNYDLLKYRFECLDRLNVDLIRSERAKQIEFML